MTTITDLTSSRKASRPTLPSGDVVVATAWLIFYLVIFATIVTSQAPPGASEFAALY